MPPWAISTATAPSSGARPTARPGCWSSSRPPESFKNSWTVQGPAALEDTDFTAKLDVPGLPAGQRIFYRVRFLDLGDLTTLSEPVAGSFATPPSTRGNVRFVWTGDCAGQGWGINPDWGGYRIFEAMRQVRPDFFVHSGDVIYADNPLKPEVDLPDGTKWKNLTTEAKSKVAETLAEFRGAHAYNLLDENLRRFNAEVPSFPQWDDHDVLNNWYWEKLLTERRPLQGEAGLDPRAPRPARLPRLPAGAARPVRARRASTAASAGARRSRSSGSTSAPTAAPTARTCRKRRATPPPSSGLPRSSG